MTAITSDEVKPNVWEKASAHDATAAAEQAMTFGCPVDPDVLAMYAMQLRCLPNRHRVSDSEHDAVSSGTSRPSGTEKHSTVESTACGLPSSCLAVTATRPTSRQACGTRPAVTSTMHKGHDAGCSPRGHGTPRPSSVDVLRHRPPHLKSSASGEGNKGTVTEGKRSKMTGDRKVKLDLPSNHN